MGAGAIHGHQERNLQSTPPPHSPSHSNSSVHQDCPSSSLSPGTTHVNHHHKITMKMSCEMCSTHFTLFKRKKFCQECHRYFCSTCLPKPPSSSPSGRQCRKCLLLISGHFTREDLQDWKVKDIRCFLDVRKVSTKGCREKHDLVELVLAQFCKNRRNSLAHQAEHDLLVQEMAARLTMDNASNRASPTHDREGSNEASDEVREEASSSSTRQRTSESESQPDRSGGEERSGTTAFSNIDTQEFRDFLQSQVEQILNSELAQREAEIDRENTAPDQRVNTRCHLEEVHTLEEIDCLSVRQLKELLVNNFVNFKGCCEKPELIQRVKRLWNDHQENLMKAEKIHKADEDSVATPSTHQDKAEEESSDDIPIPPSATTNTADSATPVAMPTTTSEERILSSDTGPSVNASSSSDAGPSAIKSCDSPLGSPSKHLPTSTDDPADSLCRVCMDSLTNCILLECGHMVTCTTCGKQLAECPICRQYISRVVRVFRS